MMIARDVRCLGDVVDHGRIPPFLPHEFSDPISLHLCLLGLRVLPPMVDGVFVLHRWSRVRMAKGSGDERKPDFFEWDIRSHVIKLRSGESRVLLDNIGKSLEPNQRLAQS